MFGAVLGRYDVYPFFSGTLATSTTVPPNTVALGGIVYPIDLKLYRHSSQDTLRDSTTVAAEPSDSLFNANGAWSRYRHTWHEGAGQTVADFRKDSSEYRFETSVGVDPWNEGELCLLKDTEVTKALTTTGNQMCVVNGYLYVSDGTNLYYTSDLTTWNTAVAPGGTIQALASDGTFLYCATTTILKKYDTATPAAAPTTFSPSVTGNCRNVAFVANRLLVEISSSTSDLYEVTSGGHSIIKSHYQASFRWTTMFAVGSRIYVGGYAGDRSEIYSLTVDSTGALVQGPEAAPLPTGELIRRGYAYAGVVVLCTNKGVRVAQVGGDGTLTYGPLISAMGDVQGAAFDGRFAYTGWTLHPSGGRGVGRLALDVSVDTLQPAYASDVYETVSTAGPVSGVARFLNNTIFVVDGINVYKEKTTYVAEGYVDSGNVYFGTVENKALTHLKIVTEPIATGQSVLASVYNERQTLISSSLQNIVSSDALEADLDGANVRYLTMRITLRSTGATTPCVRYWRLQAYPVPPPVMQWVVPLLVYSRVVVNNGMGQEKTFHVVDEADRIRTWFRTKETINYQEGQQAYRVRVDAFEVQPSSWTDDGAFFEHVMVVRLVSA